MTPTPTPEMIEAAAEAIYNLFTYDEPGEKPKWVERGNSFKQEDARRYAAAALSVPAAAVVGEPVGDIAYNAGLEIRYAIAASGVDPIQHIPEVDAIIERRLADARKAAFIEAGQKALEWAAHYSPASDGRNTFVLFYEWAEAKAEETKP